MDGLEPTTPPDPDGDERHARAVGRWLMLAAALAAAAVIPYTSSILRQAGWPGRPPGEPTAGLAENALVETLISWVMIALGFRARRSLGLGLTMLDGWPPAGAEDRRRIRNAIALSAGLGLALGAVLAVADHFVEPLMPKPARPLSDPPAWAGALASFGAGIQEEIWLRLGIMTCLVWLGTRIVRRTPPAPAIVGTANVLAAGLFGALHIPQGIALIGPSAVMVACALLGNGISGVVFGWLYWRRGLVAAMICHTAVDLILKALLPLMWTA